MCGRSPHPDITDTPPTPAPLANTAAATAGTTCLRRSHCYGRYHPRARSLCRPFCIPPPYLHYTPLSTSVGGLTTSAIAAVAITPPPATSNTRLPASVGASASSPLPPFYCSYSRGGAGR